MERPLSRALLARKLRILVLCYEFPPIGGGGGRVAKDIAEQMVTRGHEVRVQTAALGWRSFREQIAGVEIFRTASGRRAPDTCRVHEMAAFLATSFVPTLRHIREWKPDVIHAHFAVPTGALAWAAHALTGVPYVLTAHLGDVPGGVPQQTGWLFRLVGPLATPIWKCAAAATAVSTFVQQLAERAYRRPVERILNGIDLDANRAASPGVHSPRKLVFAGRFNPQKNALAIIDALAQLRDLPWHLTMIGDGPQRRAIEKRITENKLGERVTLTGWLVAPAVQRILADADILCIPSLSEGLPMAAIEALAHGLAIAGSDIPGLRDVLEDGVNGYSVAFEGRVDFSIVFAHKLRWLLASDETLLAMKHASWRKARAFDLRAIADQYERVLLRAAARVLQEPG